jgi:hypothetical protein
MGADSVFSLDVPGKPAGRENAAVQFSRCLDGPSESDIRQ